MKKTLFLLAALALSACAFYSCSSDGEDAPPPPESPISKDYFTIEGASLVPEAFPTNGQGAPIEEISYNQSALSGGMNFVVVRSATLYDKFLVGVEGVKGYWSYAPEVEDLEASGAPARAVQLRYQYRIPVNYTPTLSQDITMLVSGVKDGVVSAPYEADVAYVETQEGDLKVNLTFENEKDIDLHLFFPSGLHIYFGNRGNDMVMDDDSELFCGLDIDSNAGCYIDGVNNENIVIPEELLEVGEYRVEVDMWSNCDPSISTEWMVAARYKGNLLPNLLPEKGNPVSGVYPVGAPSGDHTEVMKFKITENQLRNAPRRGIKSMKPARRTLMDEIKLEQAALDGGFYRQ